MTASSRSRSLVPSVRPRSPPPTRTPFPVTPSLLGAAARAQAVDVALVAEPADEAAAKAAR